MNKLSTKRAIEALYTVRAYYASLTAGYPKGKDCKGIGDVMCSEIANSCLMAIKALEQLQDKPEHIDIWNVGAILHNVPEQPKKCKIYEGACGYPIEACSECPKHEGWIPPKERTETKEPMSCDRNICTQNDYNVIGCEDEDCVVTKSNAQQTDGDCISRADVHDLLATWISSYQTDEVREVLEVIDGKIEDLPSVTTTLDGEHTFAEAYDMGYEEGSDVGRNCGYAEAMRDIAESEGME